MSAIVQGPLSASSSSTPSDISRAFGSNLTIGNTVLVLFNCGQSAGLPSTATCSDTLGNTYTLDKSGARPDVAASPRDTIWFAFSAPVTTGGAATVTAAAVGSITRMEIVIFEISGLNNASLLETSNASTPTGTGTALSAGSLTTAGGGFLLAVLQGNGNYTTFTNGSGWTNIAGSSIYLRRALQYRITTVGGSYTADATANASTDWGALAVAYRDGAPPPDTTAPNITSTGTGAANGPFAVNVAENSTAVAVTLTSDEALSAVTKGGTDGALFTLAGSGLTRTLAPTSAFDFEALPHANPFVVTLTFADLATPTANERTVTVNFTVTDVSEGGGGTAPSITSQPSGQTVTAGATATFNVSATGTGSLTYQWRRNGTNISGATSASYTTPATTVSGGSANNGDLYSVVVTGDTSPPATSSNATLTVNAPGVTTYTAQTDVIAVAGIPLASTLVYYTWCPAGRPGGITAPVNGTTTTDSNGRATIAYTVAGDGFVIIGTRPGPVVANDRVFGQFLTLA